MGWEDDEEDSTYSFKNYKKLQSQTEWNLPIRGQRLSILEEKCLSDGQVFWPADGRCYSLLTNGPCNEGEWLVSRDSRVTCQPRVCPCDPLAPSLCEVQLKNMTCNNGCVVMLAAAQDGHCAPGEQLLVSPAGFGECGCVQDPPHLQWPDDGRCYQVYTRGPCPPGHVIQLDSVNSEPTCVSHECGEGQVFYEEKCHRPGFQGPCPEFEILSLDSDTLLPSCSPDPSQVSKSPYSILPIVNIKQRSAIQISKLPYRPRGRRSRLRRRRPRSFLSWLNKY